MEVPSTEKLVCTALFAIGHNNKHLQVKHLKALQQFQNSKSKDIRYALTFSLLGIDHQLAIKILIKLAQDRSQKVKDWATFGLGTQIETDNEEIRNILYKNCSSKDDQNKQEAIKGLLNRKDERVKEMIMQELKNED
ncbi:hypothetical protein SAMN05443633_107182 [Chryseobacterium arachidis]|uniref:HEAT repeat-containing protein n=1 Tax=Chryseobacterium arachidis TaxID=1416778 RepID=A0A1M5F714_9FLAO|nr:hypothetical protein [Chryseobacterium arachidis]SHF87309.1 hypothetical protein SAMN05443633_107182 [Chryseobacterium arachidis]